MKKANTIHDYLLISQKIDTDVASMHDDLVQGASHYLINALDQEANAWGNAHLYHDKFDGNNYIYTAGYTLPGIGFWLNRQLGWAYPPSPFPPASPYNNTHFSNFPTLHH